ncbi:hypothetical protein LCGC14_1493010 [marine sediment metagenome]|uniref:Uncharacterized protein n=1 Tax=marine sediment metagenome TaxID=412755 RepID=A0A0F9J6W6_9ZZZZ
MLDAYRRGCRVGVVPKKTHWTRDWQIAGVNSQVGLLKIGSREGITLDRISPGQYMYKDWWVRGSASGNVWLVGKRGERAIFHSSTLKGIREMLANIEPSEIGSREGITLDRVGTGHYLWKNYHILRTKNRWMVWDSLNPGPTHRYRTLRNVRKRLALGIPFPEVGSREGITLKPIRSGRYEYEGDKDFYFISQWEWGPTYRKWDVKGKNISAGGFRTLRDVRKWIAAREARQAIARAESS